MGQVRRVVLLGLPLPQSRGDSQGSGGGIAILEQCLGVGEEDAQLLVLGCRVRRWEYRSTTSAGENIAARGERVSASSRCSSSLQEQVLIRQVEGSNLLLHLLLKLGFHQRLLLIEWFVGRSQVDRRGSCAGDCSCHRCRG